MEKIRHIFEAVKIKVYWFIGLICLRHGEVENIIK